MKEQPTRVLIIDDEVEAAELLGMHFNRGGYEVLIAASGPEGLKLAYEHQPEAVVLDFRLPGMDGLEVCGRLRDISDAAIVFLTVVGDSDHIVRGLQLGADDYITKPVAYRELAARLEACLRRRARQGGILPAPGPAGLLWKVDESRREVEIRGRRAQLTPKEFAVFKLLMQNPDQVLATDAILETVWGTEYLGDTELVKQFMYRLRAKLEANPSEPRYFVTVRGTGYAFEPDTRRFGEGRLPAGEPPDKRATGGKVAEFRSQAAQAHPELGVGSLPVSATAKTKPSLRRKSPPGAPRLRSLRMVAMAAAVPLLALLLLLAAVVAEASTRALPGDGTYSVKVLLERVWLLATFDQDRDLALRLEFLGRRVAEIESLVQAGRTEQVPGAVGRLEGEIARATLDLNAMASAGETRQARFVERSLAVRIRELENLQQQAGTDSAPAIDRAIQVFRKFRDQALDLIGARESSPPPDSPDGSDQEGG